ncbi:hypothetical protein BFW01_g7045 [Lasiodiplodia theobromae]|uniref:BTB domain-containing protein n=3 Tax=Lasiodiplodia theobromae TaxID=45133 RepID=A0A5N5DCU7_9PEZI|nr:hypothetical protein DBV05_g5741 [Lasiodiplodia theobromae]KAF9636150.1 hypothetical protein BFW01_g7045 [Lasiodiplodia theobromae]
MAPSVRDWPRRQRHNLLKGPTATIELDAGEGKPRLVLSVPRAALMAFSTVAADLLADEQYTNVLLLQGMAAPAALRYVVEWIPRTCDSADFMPIKRKESFEQNVRIYQAALSLGVTEALTTIGGWLNLCVSDFEKQPWAWARVIDMLLTLPKDCALIDRLIEKVALARRRGVTGEDFNRQLSAFLACCPELAQRFHVEDTPELRLLKRRPSSGSEVSSHNSSNEQLATGGRKHTRGGRKHKRSPKMKANPFDYSNNRVLDDSDVDFLMGRR